MIEPWAQGIEALRGFLEYEPTENKVVVLGGSCDSPTGAVQFQGTIRERAMGKLTILALWYLQPAAGSLPADQNMPSSSV